ncbi:MAG: hypothetical protein MJ225_02225, partial [Bacilli bacterium]|nr:hypothetical protein [Bacilli bacterium]
KVSLRERGDGSPPFYGESVTGQSDSVTYVQKPIFSRIIDDVNSCMICLVLRDQKLSKIVL